MEATETYKALIVDDDPWMQRILSKTLQSFGFKDIYLASNGFEGIAIAVEEVPHIMILDILMPELTGLLTLKVLKHIKATKDIPSLMVSAYSDTGNLGKAVQIGSNGFISKPFTRSTVFDKLVQIFGKSNLDKIRKGEQIEFDASKKEDYEDSVELLAKEAELMKALGSEKSSEEYDYDPKKIRESQKQDEDKDIDAIKKLLLKTKK